MPPRVGDDARPVGWGHRVDCLRSRANSRPCTKKANVYRWTRIGRIEISIDSELQRLQLLMPVFMSVPHILCDYCFNVPVRPLHWVALWRIDWRGSMLYSEKREKLSELARRELCVITRY